LVFNWQIIGKLVLFAHVLTVNTQLLSITQNVIGSTMP